MKIICPICQKEFSINKSNRLSIHGYKYKNVIKKYNGFFISSVTKRIKISPPCKGSGKKIQIILKED